MTKTQKLWRDCDEAQAPSLIMDGRGRACGAALAMRPALLLFYAALPAVRSQGTIGCFLKFALLGFDPYDFDAYPKL